VRFPPHRTPQLVARPAGVPWVGRCPPGSACEMADAETERSTSGAGMLHVDLPRKGDWLLYAVSAEPMSPALIRSLSLKLSSLRCAAGSAPSSPARVGGSSVAGCEHRLETLAAEHSPAGADELALTLRPPSKFLSGVEHVTESVVFSHWSTMEVAGLGGALLILNSTAADPAAQLRLRFELPPTRTSYIRFPAVNSVSNPLVFTLK